MQPSVRRLSRILDDKRKRVEIIRSIEHTTQGVRSLSDHKTGVFEIVIQRLCELFNAINADELHKRNFTIPRYVCGDFAFLISRNISMSYVFKYNALLVGERSGGYISRNLDYWYNNKDTYDAIWIRTINDNLRQTVSCTTMYTTAEAEV